LGLLRWLNLQGSTIICAAQEVFQVTQTQTAPQVRRILMERGRIVQAEPPRKEVSPQA